MPNYCVPIDLKSYYAFQKFNLFVDMVHDLIPGNGNAPCTLPFAPVAPSGYEIRSASETFIENANRRGQLFYDCLISLRLLLSILNMKLLNRQFCLNSLRTQEVAWFRSQSALGPTRYRDVL